MRNELISYIIIRFAVVSLKIKMKGFEIMENKQINNYETVFILKGSFTKEEYQRALNKVKGYIKDLTEIEKIEEMGLKLLAYDISQQTTGYFVVIEFKSKVENIKELERLYRIDENVLKYIIIKK